MIPNLAKITRSKHTFSKLLKVVSNARIQIYHVLNSALRSKALTNRQIGTYRKCHYNLNLHASNFTGKLVEKMNIMQHSWSRWWSLLGSVFMAKDLWTCGGKDSKLFWNCLKREKCLMAMANLMFLLTESMVVRLWSFFLRN